MLLDAFEMTDRRVVGLIRVENATMTCCDFKIKITGHSNAPLRSKKAGRFAKLLGFARSYSIVTRGSVSLSCAATPHPT